MENVERLMRYLSLFSIIGWRIYWMTYINRQSPEAPCSIVLAKHEWEALYCTINRSRELPKEIPGVREVVRWIARLGGFLG